MQGLLLNVSPSAFLLSHRRKRNASGVRMHARGRGMEVPQKPATLLRRRALYENTLFNIARGK